ncbi:MAG: hypothetical protein M3135_04695 [Actinomycetota bacterium]|nr:hypothetical protein [Actinomycetota bacterium]
MTGIPPTTPPSGPPPTWPGAPPPAGPRLQRLSVELEAVLRTGWGRGALAAVAVFAVLFVLNLMVAAVQQSGPNAVEFAGQQIQVPEASTVDLLQSALAALYFWHGVGASASFGPIPAQAGFPGDFDVSFSVALILGTFVALVALFLAGRWAGGRNEHPRWAGLVRGLQVALPYGLLAVVLSPLASAEQAIPGIPETGVVPGGGPSVEVELSLLGAFAMPFLFALVAAGAGALGHAARTAPGLFRRVAGAMAGGWRMLWLSVALSVVGFLVVMAVNPDPTRAYFEFVSQDGALGVVRGVLLTAFLLGNIGVYVTAAAAGSAIGVSALGGSCSLISYLTFPVGTRENVPGGAEGFADPCGALPLEFGAAPAPYLLFLLVPVVATVLGGRLAARRAEARTVSDGATVGAAAGFVFALLVLGFVWLSDLSYEVAFFFTVEASFGPVPVLTFFLILVWGLVGGALGGWLGSRGAREPVGPTGFQQEPGTTTGPG